MGVFALKVLLSAFACEPNKGSEFAVGWNWAVFLARSGRDVVVLTRSQSRAAIECAMKDLTVQGRLDFRYFDVPKSLRWQSRGPLHLHHALWQWRAVRYAKNLHSVEHFDCVHHVTYAGLRAPSFMGRLGIPFILGPVGGGESAPWSLRFGYSLTGLVHDAARDAANLATRFAPFMIGTFASAQRIYVTSPETLRLMPSVFRGKAKVELAIGAEDQPSGMRVMPLRERMADTRFRVLYAGRFVDYKGMHLGLPAFAHLVRAMPDAQLTMVGEGPQEGRWRRLAGELRLTRSVQWLGWQDRQAMAGLYAGHDVLLFPAMHDSGGMVVLEAMGQGLPVVCLKLGGPATMVDDSCGCVIDPTGKSAAQVAQEMGSALIALAADAAHHRFAQGARLRCHAFSWPEKVARIYGLAV
jgi:glycosyltransferase involved in cell wall biosynthesis